MRLEGRGSGIEVRGASQRTPVFGIFFWNIREE